jgi:hypothetical protein
MSLTSFITQLGAAGVAGGGPATVAFTAANVSDTVAAFDISDPSNITLLGSVTDATNLNNIRSLALDTVNNVVYAAASSGRITAVDVSDPTNPSVISSLCWILETLWHICLVTTILFLLIYQTQLQWLSWTPIFLAHQLHLDGVR